jgi:hypothetical protein
MLDKKVDKNAMLFFFLVRANHIISHHADGDATHLVIAISLWKQCGSNSDLITRNVIPYTYFCRRVRPNSPPAK